MNKANPDYTISAVNLCNPPEVRDCLIAQRFRIQKLAELKAQAEALIPEPLTVAIANLQAEIAAEDKGIRGFIDTFGSYQDIEQGSYAVKQRRETIIYQAKLVRVKLPAKVSELVIVESVDTKALDSLIKGGLVTPEQARQCGEVKESFAYIVR